MDDNDANALRLTHLFTGPPALVWAVWTRPELIRSWFGSSHGFRAHDIAVDLRPGGNWSLRNVNGAITEHVSGTCHEVIPDQRLTFSSHFNEFDVHSVISVRFAPEGQGTRMRFLQTGLPDEETWRGHQSGWLSSFAILEDLLLRLHGIGTVYPTLPPAKHSAVAQDLAEARRRHDQATAAPAP